MSDRRNVRGGSRAAGTAPRPRDPRGRGARSARAPSRRLLNVDTPRAHPPYPTGSAQLAAGYGRVIAPSASGNKAIASPGSQAAALAAAGARVEVITPGTAAKKAFGRNPLDPSCRAAAARAGLAQSTAHTEAVAAILSS